MGESSVRRGRVPWRSAGGCLAALGLLAACGGFDTTGGGGDEEFSVLLITENTTVPHVLRALAATTCRDADADLPLRVETVPQILLDQKLQLLAGQQALPVAFAAGGAPALTEELAAAGHLVDLEQTLAELDVLDELAPAAVETVKALYGGELTVLPVEYNVEGFWFNTDLLAAHDLAAPTTWSELEATAAALHRAGVQPFSASGEQGWPLTRLIGGYLYRALGPDALERVARGEARLTDPPYVEAVEAVARLGRAGYFGEGLGSVDYGTALNTFLTGDAAMLYMGSWVLGSFGDDRLNEIGIEHIGFFPFPEVTGGIGGAEQVPANVGIPLAFSAKRYDDRVGAWLTCIADGFGTVSLAEHGLVSGFRARTVAEVDPLTAEVGDLVRSATGSVLWFEALFGTRATTLSQRSAAPLLAGSVSADEFAADVQAALDLER